MASVWGGGEQPLLPSERSRCRWHGSGYWRYPGAIVCPSASWWLFPQIKLFLADWVVSFPVFLLPGRIWRRRNGTQLSKQLDEHPIWGKTASRRAVASVSFSRIFPATRYVSCPRYLVQPFLYFRSKTPDWLKSLLLYSRLSVCNQ